MVQPLIPLDINNLSYKTLLPKVRELASASVHTNSYSFSEETRVLVWTISKENSPWYSLTGPCMWPAHLAECYPDNSTGPLVFAPWAVKQHKQQRQQPPLQEEVKSCFSSPNLVNYEIIQKTKIQGKQNLHSF